MVMGMFNNTLDIENNMRGFASKSNIGDDSDFDDMQFASGGGSVGIGELLIRSIGNTVRKIEPFGECIYSLSMDWWGG